MQVVESSLIKKVECFWVLSIISFFVDLYIYIYICVCVVILIIFICFTNGGETKRQILILIIKED